MVIGSDSGRIVVLKSDKEKNQFEQVHKETFGKSGVRRVVPGQFCCGSERKSGHVSRVRETKSGVRFEQDYRQI